MATYKTGWLRLPNDPKDFKERFAWSHVKSIFYDKAKNILLKKKLDDMDALISEHADAIANKLMTNDAFNTAIADYVTKAMMSSTQVNDANHVPTSSLAYAMQQAITANANAITQLNSESFFIPISYFKTNINKTYSDIYTFVFGKLVVLSISILIDSFNNYFGEVTSDIRQIQRLKSLDSKTVKASGIVRSGDNSKTLGHIGSLMYDGSSGKIMANIIGSGSDSNPTSIQNGYVIGELVLFLK